MILFSSIFVIFIFILFLWMVLIASNKSKSDEEKFIEDNLQMKYLKEISLKKKFY